MNEFRQKFGKKRTRAHSILVQYLHELENDPTQRKLYYKLDKEFDHLYDHTMNTGHRKILRILRENKVNVSLKSENNKIFNQFISDLKQAFRALELDESDKQMLEKIKSVPPLSCP